MFGNDYARSFYSKPLDDTLNSLGAETGASDR